MRVNPSTFEGNPPFPPLPCVGSKKDGRPGEHVHTSLSKVAYSAEDARRNPSITDIDSAVALFAVGLRGPFGSCYKLPLE